MDLLMNLNKLVCKLNRSLYGLKQAPRAWYHRLSQHLLTLGFISSKSDTSLFVRDQQVYILLLVYVDDILVTDNNNGVIDSLIHKLKSEFALKDLGELSFFSWS